MTARSSWAGGGMGGLRRPLSFPAVWEHYLGGRKHRGQRPIEAAVQPGGGLS